MRHNAEMTGSIARERLKFMIESGQMENSPNLMERMKKEISEIISRYYDILFTSLHHYMKRRENR